jgi:hypothetical protein
MGSLLSTVAGSLGLSFRRPEVDGYQRMSECVNLNGKRSKSRLSPMRKAGAFSGTLIVRRNWHTMLMQARSLDFGSGQPYGQTHQPAHLRSG